MLTTTFKLYEGAVLYSEFPEELKTMLLVETELDFYESICVEIFSGRTILFNKG